MFLSVQDLRDRLWDICDAQKEEAEQERLDIINESWLQDSMGITMNHFFSLMQVRAASHEYKLFPPQPCPSCNNSFRTVRSLFRAHFTYSILPSLSSCLPRKLAEINDFGLHQTSIRNGSIPNN